MHTAEIALLAMLIAPVLMIMLLRANGTLVFLSLCLGAVVTQFLSRDITDFAKMFFPEANLASYELQIALTVVPALVTAVLMLRSVRGLRYWLNILPALAVGGLVPLLVVPLLPSFVRQQVTHEAVWQGLSRAQDLIVGVGAFISLLFLWVQRVKRGKESSDKKSA